MKEQIKNFGTYLRETREGFKLSLRKFADEVNVDPAYLSRIESGKIVKPGRGVIEKIASAFCREIHLQSKLILSPTYAPDAECEELRRQLLLSAGYKLTDAELLGFKADQSYSIEDLFAERLKDKGVPDKYISIAKKKVPQDLMTKVLSGEEFLNRWIGLDDNPNEYISQYYIPSSIQDSSSASLRNQKDTETKFRAGSRAFIHVDGDLSSTQEEQLRALSALVKSILKNN
jgi:transcriptional regulator with XRE-family HTH domain